MFEIIQQRLAVKLGLLATVAVAAGFSLASMMSTETLLRSTSRLHRDAAGGIAASISASVRTAMLAGDGAHVRRLVSEVKTRLPRVGIRMFSARGEEVFGAKPHAPAPDQVPVLVRAAVTSGKPAENGDELARPIARGERCGACHAGGEVLGVLTLGAARPHAPADDQGAALDTLTAIIRDGFYRVMLAPSARRMNDYFPELVRRVPGVRGAAVYGADGKLAYGDPAPRDAKLLVRVAPLRSEPRCLGCHKNANEVDGSTLAVAFEPDRAAAEGMLPLLVETVLEQVMATGLGRLAIGFLDDVAQTGALRSLTLHDAEGRLVHDAFGHPSPQADVAHVLRTGTARAIVPESAPEFVFVEPLSNEQPCQACHGSDTPMRGAIEIRLDTSEERAELASLRRSAIAYGVSTIVLVLVLLALGLYYTVIRPVRAIGSVADLVGAGRLDAIVDLQTSDEMGRLGHRINDMVGGLRQKQRLAFALEGSNSAVWDWDLRRDEIFLSAGWARMLGAQGQETTSTPAELLALVHPDDLKQVQEVVQGALKGVTPEYLEEHRVRRVDGEWIWILSRGKVVGRDPKGRPVRMAGINQDISDRKRADLTLKEHDERLRLALETAVMASWDWNVASDEFAWHDSPERLVGSVPPSGYPGLKNLVHPEDLAHFIRTLNSVAQTGEAYRDEYRIIRTDGRLVWILARGRAERDPGGKVTRVIGVAQDISEIKEAEHALRVSEGQMRLVTNAVPAMIAYADAGELIRFANRPMEIMLGVRPEDAIGRSLSEALGEAGYRQARPFVLRALAGEEVHFERIQETPRGSLDLSVVYVPRRDERGGVEGFYALATDITEIKRLDRMKSEFVSTVSHELRTPLTSIRGSLGVLAGGVAGVLPEKARTFIDIAKNNCERLIRLINDILDMEKFESGKMTFQLQVLDLMELIEQVVKANEGFAAQHKVRLQVIACLAGARVHADSDRLAQVLTNLVSNACKFSPTESSVDIAVSRHEERIRVDVIDHGPGISEEFRNRIFQKFSQADSSDVRQKGGTGLGLSISKAIVEGLGGEIGFETAASKGTRFFFFLPEWREPLVASAPAFTGRPRVLICEDDADVGKLLQIMVDKAGCDSDLAGSAAEAKALLRERRYAAITLDLRLPDQDGLSLLRELRANAEVAAVPVIVVSATAQDGKLMMGGESLGVVDWLSKPIDEARLLDDLRSSVGAGAHLRVLHVEDDADVRNVVAMLGRDIADFDSAESLVQAKSKLEQGVFDLVLLDLGLPDGSGWELLSLVNRLTPRPRVVIFSARDAGQENEAARYTFLVKSQTSEKQLLAAIDGAVRGSA